MKTRENRIQALVEFCSVPRSRSEMMDYIGVVNVNGFTTNYLEPMQERGLIRKTVPEKPRYRYQKYVRREAVIMFREFYLPCGGIDLHCKLETAKEGKQPLVILQHGLTGHMEERHIIGIKDALLGAGCAVLRTELYGHGKSGGEFKDHTVWKWVDEMLSIISYARKLDFVTKLYLSGHSQGGLTALLAGGMAADELDGLLLLAPAVVIRDACREGQLFSMKLDTNALTDTTASDGRVYGADYFRAGKCLPVEDCVDAFTKPVLIVHADTDEAVPYHYAEDLLKLYHNAKLVTLPGDTHCFDLHLDIAQAACAEFMKNEH